MFLCYAKPLPFTYLDLTLQHLRHKIRKALSRPNFSYLSVNFFSGVTCNMMVNTTIIQKNPQNFQKRQKNVIVSCQMNLHCLARSPVIAVDHTSKSNVIQSILNPPLTVYNTENGVSLFQKLPDKSQILGKRQLISLLEIEKKESKTPNTFHKIVRIKITTFYKQRLSIIQ